MNETPNFDNARINRCNATTHRIDVSVSWSGYLIIATHPGWVETAVSVQAIVEQLKRRLGTIRFIFDGSVPDEMINNIKKEMSHG